MKPVVAAVLLSAVCAATTGCAAKPDDVTTSHAEISSKTLDHLATWRNGDLGRAFEAVYGTRPPLRLNAGRCAYGAPPSAKCTEAANRADALMERWDMSGTITPLALFQMGSGTWVLVSQGLYDESGCANFGGHLIVHYLRRTGDRFEPFAELLDGGGGQYCDGMADWRVRYDIEREPVIWVDRDYAHQGMRWMYHDIVSLKPDRPHLTGQGIVSLKGMYAFDQDYDTGKPYCDIHGKIVPDPAHGAFTIQFTGNARKSVRYRLTNGAYSSPDDGWVDEASYKSCPPAPQSD